MTIYRVPTTNKTSSFTQVTALEGRDYDLTFRWNQREDRWYLDISSNGQALLKGLKLIADWPLFRAQTSELLPPGELIAFDQTGKGRDPGLRDLGSRVELFYFDSEEMARLAND